MPSNPSSPAELAALAVFAQLGWVSGDTVTQLIASAAGVVAVLAAGLNVLLWVIDWLRPRSRK
jgi:hypothetical protein